jgi:hypothetical protein
MRNNIDIIHWHIQRNDMLRNTISTRATIVLTANAILITGMYFLLEKVILIRNLPSKLLIITFNVICLILILLSVIYAFNSILSIWKPNRKMIENGYSVDEMLFYYASSTVQCISTKEKFIEKFKCLNDEQLLNYARTSLWYGTNLYHHRYEKLRRSIRFLLIAFIGLILAIIIYTINTWLIVPTGINLQ